MVLGSLGPAILLLVSKACEGAGMTQLMIDPDFQLLMRNNVREALADLARDPNFRTMVESAVRDAICKLTVADIVEVAVRQILGTEASVADWCLGGK